MSMRLYACILSCILVAGCASAPGKKSRKSKSTASAPTGARTPAPMPSPTPSPMPSDSEHGEGRQERADFREIQSLFSGASYAALIPKAELYLQRYTKASRVAEVHNFMGLALLLTQKAAPAAAEFKKSVAANTNPAHRDFILYNLAAAQVDAGQLSEAEGTIETIQPETLDQETAGKLRTLRTRLGEKKQLVVPPEDAGPAEARAIGVLLPLKGKFARMGARALQGVEMALRIFNPDTPASKLSLIIQDSGEDAESALSGLNTLVLKHHVVAVIGPLLSKGVDQVTSRAQALGVPLISLSQKQGAPGAWVFQACPTSRTQVEQVTRYVVEQMNHRKFAILYPKDKFGEEYSQLFWDAVEGLDAQIVGIESYRPDETDFRQVVDRLGGLYYQDARAREVEELARLREETNVKKRTRKTEQFFALKPIVDFDAVFIADEPKVIGQLLPTFAYRDIDKIQFIGPATWHSPDLVQRAGSHAEGAIFADSFAAESKSPGTLKFIEKYRATFSQDPGATEALAYDAGTLLEKILTPPEVKTREDVRDALREIKNFAGVTGKISFKDGQLHRDLKILTVKQGKITER